MRSFFPIIFIVLAIAGGVIFVAPLFSEVSKLRTDVTAYNTALTHSTELQKVRDGLLDAYNTIPKTDKEKLTRFMPNTVDNIQLILEVQKIASRHGMSLKNISFDAPKPEGAVVNGVPDQGPQTPYGIFHLAFNTESDYATFLEFLKDLEINLRLIDIESISFSVPDKKAPASALTANDSNPNVYAYNIKLQTYWLKH